MSASNAQYLWSFRPELYSLYIEISADQSFQYETSWSRSSPFCIFPFKFMPVDVRSFISSFSLKYVCRMELWIQPNADTALAVPRDHGESPLDIVAMPIARACAAKTYIVCIQVGAWPAVAVSALQRSSWMGRRQRHGIERKEKTS